MIRFGSRGSDLALTQTKLVAETLAARTGEEFTIEVIETRGDRNLTDPLAKIGAKGLFTAELEAALREGRIDVAVHSLKDLPVMDPDFLTLGAIPERAAPHDVLLFTPDARDPEGGTVPLLAERVVGTSSPRRTSSLLALRPDLRITDIRGNVDTRARKVADGDYHATVLAAAGLARLGLETPDLLRQDLPVELCTPAPGQGALGVQCRAGDERILQALATIHDAETAACVHAERQLLFLLGGGCSMPLGALVRPEGEGYRMIASLFSESQPACGTTLDLRGSDPEELSKRAALELRPFLGDPLAGRRIALLRAGGSDGRLARALGLAGAEVETVVVSEILPLQERTAELKTDDVRVLAFTSARAVDRFFEQAAAFRLDLSASRFFAGGPATADAVRRRGHECETPEEGSGGRALGALIARSVDGSAKVLFPCAENRHPDLENELTNAGLAVEALPIYRTVVLSGVDIPAADHVVFTSPSAVRAYRAGTATLRHGSSIALGPTTAQAMESIGCAPAAVATAPTARALLEVMLP